jgi:phytanoyl-CoA hydroxylase
VASADAGPGADLDRLSFFLVEEPSLRLSEEQVSQFRREGYLAVPGFWSPREVAAIRAELDRLKRDGLLRNVATAGDGKTPATTKANLQLCPMNNRSDFFRALGFAPQVAPAVSQLIGDPVLWHLDQVFLKPGRHGSGTNWHQDNAYFKIGDPLQGTAMWTAVHDATIANGTIEIIPGSFRESYDHTRDMESDHHIRCYPPEDRALPIELPAGGVLFFAYGVAHCTRANNTDHERAGVALHFINGDADGAALGGFAPGLRPYLTGPRATGGLREYGVEVAGTWDAEIDRVLSGSQDPRPTPV